MMKAADIAALAERSKNDREIIVGSEVRAVCAMALRSLADLAGCDAAIADIKAARDAGQRQLVAAHAEIVTLRTLVADMEASARAGVALLDRLRGDAAARPGFEKELAQIINRYSLENLSDTPDFLLATMLVDVLNIVSIMVARRECWHGRATAPAKTEGGNG
jgi:hypothetical protein